MATTSEHDFCRGLLKAAMKEIQEANPGRFVRAEVTSECRIGNTHHFTVKVTDHEFALGKRPCGATGHARFPEYEVEGCCRYSAKMTALDMLADDFGRLS